MGRQEDLFAAVLERLRQVEATGSPLPVLGREALLEARLLASMPAAREDLRTRCTLGWVFWFRYQGAPPAQRRSELEAALEMFAPCFLAGYEGLSGLPDDLILLMAELATPDAIAWLNRAVLSGDPTSVKTAVLQWIRITEATPTDHPMWMKRVVNLAAALTTLHEHTGAVEPLDEAIRIGRLAVDATDDDRPAWLMCLTNLGSALRTRFSVTHSMDDLNEAVRIGRDTVHRTDHGDPELAIRLWNLDIALENRFAVAGALEDIDEAVQVAQQLVDAPDSHRPGRADRLMRLAAMLHARYGRTHELQDLDEQIRVLRLAASASSGPERTEQLSHIAARFMTRLEHTRELGDLDQAIEAHREIADSISDEDPDKAKYFGRFYMALRARIAHTQTLDDADEALAVGLMALSGIPEDEPAHAVLHSSLNELALVRFGHSDETAADKPAEGPRPAGEEGTHGSCTTRIVMDLGADNRLTASVELDGVPEPGPIGDPVDFSWPLDADTQEDIRWYIEDYLRTPFGVYDDRGTRIAARFEEWGCRLFHSLFGSQPVLEAYQRARDSGCAMELVVRCAAAGPLPLALPWELLFDPAASAPLALRRIAITRMLTTAQEAESLAASGTRLRVLMVISRPRGPADVDYHMIARHLLPLLEASGDAVDMVVLRPPTLAGLEEVLAEAVQAGEPFQVVHFDGHGAHGDGPDAVGALTFEGPRGGAHRVPADRVADALAGGGVPVVVLNACESGRIGGSGVEATVATRLLQGGVSSVVAMAYKAYTAAAAEFMAVFYRRLFAGDRVADAVTAGRSRLAVANLRPSPRGRLPLEDWIVPVHYAGRDVRFADLESAPGGPRSAVDGADRAPASEEPAESSGDRGDLAAAGPFVGRDALLYTLEGAARSAKVVLLHGPGGNGKSELAKAFGRWWRDTGGVDRPEWVIWHSFEPGVASFGLDGVINVVGQRVLGTEFALLDPSARRAAVQGLLDQRRILLIWDNFESVYSMPDPTTATTLAAAQREELLEFLAHLRDHGTASMVITSRTDEGWLGPVHRVEVGGLSPQEAGDYADLLLAHSPRARSRRAGREFAELIQWLDGHPLSMRVILPLLQEYEPRQLLADLRDGRSGGVVAAADGRADPLRACVAYSYGHLSGRDQEALWILSLFHGSIDAHFLKIAFGADSEAPIQFRSYDVESWEQLLDRALAVGLLSRLRSGGYRIHPALPAFVADQWAAGRPETFAQERRDAQRVAAETFSALGQFIREQIAEGNSQRALEIIEDHRRNFGVFLEYALEQRMWLQVGGISQGLNAYWELLGLSHEAGEWFRRIRDAVERPDGSPPDPTTDAGLLWQQTASIEGFWQIQAFHLDEAERTYMSLLMANQQLEPTPTVLTAIANCYHQLGIVADQRVQWDEAEAWYRKSLAVKEQLPEVPHVSNTYHHLGLLAQRRRRWHEAEAWYYKALAGDREAGEGTSAANTYHQLGRVAQEQGLWDQAEERYKQAVAIRRPLDDRTNLAKSYYHLGIVAQEQQNWERAEVWYRKALIIHENLGNRTSIASCYHQLAVLAGLRQRWEEAEAWGQKAIGIQKELGDRVGTARSLLQFGALAVRRGRISEGLAWTVQGLVQFDSFPHPATAPAPEGLRAMVEAFGIEILERTWREVAGEPLPDRVREYVTAEALPEYIEEGGPTP